jgi:hypothetical protein
MMCSKRRASALLIGVAMMSGCFEEENEIQTSSSDDFFQGEGPESDGDCDPYFGDCEDGVPMITLDSGVLDAGSIDAGCEDSAVQPPPLCDPYNEECAPEEPQEPPVEPTPEEPQCDPYAGQCESPEEPTEFEEPTEPEECDPYVDVCGPPVN